MEIVLGKKPRGMMGKVEEMEKSHRHVTPILFSGGMPVVGGGRGLQGYQGCESLRGMGSGILLVMYNTFRTLGKGGFRGLWWRGGSVWVCANIVTVPKRRVLETGSSRR